MGLHYQIILKDESMHFFQKWEGDVDNDFCFMSDFLFALSTLKSFIYFIEIYLLLIYQDKICSMSYALITTF